MTDKCICEGGVFETSAHFIHEWTIVADDGGHALMHVIYTPFKKEVDHIDFMPARFCPACGKEL